ncbi:40S ribosomal protein S25-2 [Citrus sinensis]|nr:40S ribosomal protein S25-2 [Citrus sinensis]
MPPKKDKAPPSSSKPAQSGGGKQKKKQKEKVNNMVLFDQGTYDKHFPKPHFFYPFWLPSNEAGFNCLVHISGSLASRAIKDLVARGSIRMISAYASQQIYTRVINT